MAQTADGMAFTNALVFVSADGSTWIDVSGFGAAVSVSGGERNVGEQQTFDGDTPIVKAGDRNAIQLTVKYAYTEEAGDPYELLRAQHETVGGPIYAMYSPKNGFWFKTGAAILVKPGYPGGDAGDGAPVMSEFVIKCAELTQATAS